MVIWISGNSRSGKTTLAKRLLSFCKGGIHLDGDDMRKSISRDLKFSREDRRESNLRTARLAQLLSSQGHLVVVSTICPYADLREEVRRICGCEFIVLEGGLPPSDEFPFEK